MPLSNRDTLSRRCTGCLPTEVSVGGEKLAHFLQYCLLPIIMPFDGRNHLVVIMDNAYIHNVKEVVELPTGVGVLSGFHLLILLT